MRFNILPVVLVAVVAASGAFAATSAATTADGVIKSIDAKAMSITLADGTVYMLPKGFKVDTVKVGEKVAVTFDKKGKANDATEVKAAM